MAKEWIPEVVRRVRQLDPAVTVEVSLNEPHSGRGRRPADLDIRNESLDESPESLDGYQRQELGLDEFAAVLPRDHRLCAEPAVALGQLAGEPWVDHDIYDSPTGRIILAGCQAAGFTPAYSARLDDHHAALSLIAAGLGVTILPQLALADLPRDVAVRPIHSPQVRRRIVAHIRRSSGSDPLVAAALDCLRDQAAELSAG